MNQKVLLFGCNGVKAKTKGNKAFYRKAFLKQDISSRHIIFLSLSINT